MFGAEKIMFNGLEARKTRLRTKAIRLVVPGLAVAGWLAMCLPSKAVTATFFNDYRVCAAQLQSVGVAPSAITQGCANALRPKDLSSCVYRIQKQAQIPSADAIAPCRQARRPNDFASCVIGIVKNSKEAVNPAVLSYCGRALLPVNYAQCVVGLRAEIDIASNQALESCIDASDRVTGVLPSFVPAANQGIEFRPGLDSTPSPAVRPPITAPSSTPTPVIPPATGPNTGTPPATAPSR